VTVTLVTPASDCHAATMFMPLPLTETYKNDDRWIVTKNETHPAANRGFTLLT
jgi:hypothetical protein